MFINDLYEFYKEVVASNFTDTVEAPHIKSLSRELMRMYLGDYKRLCCSMPPRHSKSSMITITYPLWLILNKPELNILIVTSSGSLSEKFGIEIREYIRRIGEYFNVHLSDVKHSSTHIRFEDRNGELYRGSIRLVGANGTITGTDADYLIVDDPYKGFEDITPTQLEKKWDWFNTLILQRLEPESRLIILHTKWHTKDLISRLETERTDDYHFISFPAIKPDGSPLWRERYTRELLEKKRSEMGERLFQSIYQQKPIDDTSDFFNLQRIHWEPPQDMKITQTVRGYDIASTEKNGDYTAGVQIGLLDDGRSIIITDLIHGQYGGDTSRIVKEQVKQDGHDNINIIETGVAAAGKLLFEEWEHQLKGYFVERGLAVADKSKSDRATPLKNKIEDGEVYVDIHDNQLRQKLINEFRSFPDGAHDDIVDATAHAYNYLYKEFIETIPFDIIQV